MKYIRFGSEIETWAKGLCGIGGGLIDLCSLIQYTCRPDLTESSHVVQLYHIILSTGNACLLACHAHRMCLTQHVPPALTTVPLCGPHDNAIQSRSLQPHTCIRTFCRDTAVTAESCCQMWPPGALLLIVKVVYNSI